MKIKSTTILCLQILLMIVRSGYAQTTSHQDASIRNKIKLPPSPNAASLGKYGEIPVGLFTGVPNINIPLVEVKSGKLTLPIGLNYHYTGFKVEERASWTGLGWSLTAGGVITRVMQGLPDEMSTGYKNIMGAGGLIDSPDPITERTDFFNMPVGLTDGQKSLLAGGTWDALPDMYYFNFMGRSGKIIFSERGITTIPYQALKIVRDGSNWVITDEAGVKYVFGVSENRNGIETTEYDDTSPFTGVPLIPATQTSWYLVDVISPQGDVIKLDYAAEGTTGFGQDSQTKYHYKLIANPTVDQVCKELTPLQQNYATYMYTNGKRLKSIKFSDGEVSFLADTLRNDVYLGDQLKRLDHIVLRNANNEFVKQFNFTYDYLGDNNVNTTSKIFNRLMLTSITEEGKNGLKNNPHQFTYKRGLIPGTGSYSFDHWGYYNGASNGTNLIPKNLNTENDKYFQVNTADHEPNTDYASIGLISKIIYPTGGNSEFIYEQHDYGNINGINYNGEYQKNYYYNTANVTNPNSGAQIQVKEQVTNFSLALAQEVLLSYRVQWPSFLGLGENYVALYKIGQTTPLLMFAGDDSQNLMEEFKYLEAGNYKLVAHIEDRGYKADININYQGEDTFVFKKHKAAGGLRIKSIINSPVDETSLKEISNYIYRLAADSLKSSGVLNAVPTYEYNTTIVGFYTILTGPDAGRNDECNCPMIARTSNSVAPLGASDGGNVTYSEVKVVKNNGANGSARSWFTSAIDFPDNLYNAPPFAPTLNQADRRGLLVKEEQYDKDGKTLQAILNDYEYNRTLSSPNLYGTGLLAVSYREKHPIYPYLNKFDYVLYDIKSAWNYLKKSSKTIYNYAPGGVKDSVVTSSDYIYANPAHIQLTESRTKNSKNQVISTFNRYPHDMIALGKTEPYQEMVNRHIYAPVIEEEQHVNAVMQSREVTNYKRGWSFNPDLILPDSIQTQNQNDPIETRFRYLEYDDKANPLTVSQEKGSKVCYVWAYGKSIPVAEINNADYATVEAVLGNASVVNIFSNKLRPTNAEVIAFLAPLRTDVRLKNAMVTTCTFDPLVGMTSQTDAKGMTVYYEYDNFQRLKYIKDQNGNIIKANDYHYKP